MTDKQIIIDGCDFQNCEFFKYCDTDVEFSKCLAHWHPNEDYSNVYYAYCDAYLNCYYKQLKAKEQECERLKEWLPIVVRLEEQFKSHEKAKGINYKTYAEQVFTELDQLKQTLTEIKEIIHFNKTNRLSGGADISIEQILQKISEVNQCENL